MSAAKLFPNFKYWLRLPGFTAFCGISVGICAAKIGLASYREYVPNALIYIPLLLTVTIFLMICGCLSRRVCVRFALLAAGGAALFSWSELGIRDFYGRMESVCENRRLLTLTARISSPVAEGPTGFKFRARVIGADDEEVARALAGKTLQCVSKQPVPPFGVITAQGRYAAPRNAAGPFGFDLREHFAVNGISGSFSIGRIAGVDNNPSINRAPVSAGAAGNVSTLRMSIPYALRSRVHSVINMAKTQEARGVLHAAFLGEREHLPESLNTRFRKAGIIHLLAISGFHAALLYSAVFAALSLFRVPSRAKTLIALAALWGYLFLIGFIPSLFRATAMATLLCVSVMLQRKNHIVHTLGLAGFFWLCFSPHSLFAPGFQLSFAATAGIAMLQPALSGITLAVNSNINNKQTVFLVDKLLSPLWVSVATFAATAPPLLYHFGSLSLYGILFNLIAIPLMSAAMWLFLAAVALSPVAAAANALILCAEKVLNLMFFLSGFCERVPVSEIIVPNISPAPLVTTVIFMAGLCAVRAESRKVYALRAGAAAMSVIAVTALYASITAKTENIALRSGGATVNVVIHRDNAAWVVAQGRKNDARNLRIREVEPLLIRRGVRSVPLVVVDEHLEEEAHEFAFNTGFAPRIVALRDGRRTGGTAGEQGGYAKLDGTGFINSDGTCRLAVGSDGRAAITLLPPRSRSLD
ncbi:MAG: ComEC/Rec2 family competence protein [Chitinispirillales bacterium]|jgi:ComEC/Rec2-related protein|nr:ComEC/Rec2 family competence protein [Chitinispirillales bacterium]